MGIEKRIKIEFPPYKFCDEDVELASQIKGLTYVEHFSLKSLPSFPPRILQFI
jgi:hypothetical protein